MSQPDFEDFDQRAVLLKIQPTDADAEPDESTDGFRLFDGSSQIEGDIVERNADKPHLGNNPFVVANERATIKGMFELWAPAEPGQAANSDAWAAIMLRPAGMAVAKNAVEAITRYNPVSAGIAKITGYWTHAKELVKALGARVDIDELKIEIGQRFMASGTILGELSDDGVTEAAMPTVTLPTKVPVVATKRNTECVISTLVRGGTASTDGTPLNGLHVWAESLKVSFGNNLTYKELTEASRTKVNRKGTFTARIAQTDITDDFNPHYVRKHGIIITIDVSLWESHTKVGLYSVLGVRGQIETVTAIDLGGSKGWELKGRCIPSDSGNDEFYVGFGDNSFKLRGSLPNGDEGVAYSSGSSLFATGDYMGTLSWAVTTGTLPTGLSINAATGAVTGTPGVGTAGSHTVTITATDDTTPTALVATKSVTFTIA